MSGYNTAHHTPNVNPNIDNAYLYKANAYSIYC